MNEPSEKLQTLPLSKVIKRNNRTKQSKCARAFFAVANSRDYR